MSVFYNDNVDAGGWFQRRMRVQCESWRVVSMKTNAADLKKPTKDVFILLMFFFVKAYHIHLA